MQATLYCRATCGVQWSEHMKNVDVAIAIVCHLLLDLECRHFTASLYAIIYLHLLFTFCQSRAGHRLSQYSALFTNQAIIKNLFLG